MSFDWKKSQIFYKESNIYNFSNNPLLRKQRTVHAYIPWDTSLDEELLFKIKAEIKEKGESYIPWMNYAQEPCHIPDEDIVNFKDQLTTGHFETILVMCNGNTIHVLKVESLTKSGKAAKKISSKVSKFYKGNPEQYKYWFKVNDVFVYDVSHVENHQEVMTNLEELISDESQQSIFDQQNLQNTNKEAVDDGAVPERWVDLDRSVTYEYFIKSCELEDNIYQDSWKHLSRKTQHALIMSELERTHCVFFRGSEKWYHLELAFTTYTQALINELNELYVFPLVYAIKNYDCLEKAWNEIQSGSMHKSNMQYIQNILEGHTNYLDHINEFLIFARNAKSCFFSLKNQFLKKLFHEDSLLIENFLSQSETLIGSFLCKELDQQVQAILDVQNWINSCDNIIDDVHPENLRDINSKLTHILSMLTSASYNENIFFKLLEEKSSKGLGQRTLEEEVKTLMSMEFKKVG